ncbi:TPA: TraR/DksA C4-type zinc finger protein [Citrobacter amalonaticus]
MTDEMDKVSEAEIADRERALNACLNRVNERPHKTGYCNDCGLPIDPKRVAALTGVVTCIDCQQRRERMS